MAPPVDFVRGDSAGPSATSVVVIGGGIIGVCTAFFLARKGVPVVLCEKGEIAAEQSGRNGGWCGKMGHDPRELPLAVEAMRLWPEMNSLIGGETGFRRAGIAYLCRTPRELRKRESWLELVAKPAGLDTRMLTRDQACRALPGLSGAWLGALYTPTDGGAEPALAAPAIAGSARRLGAVILTRCAVRGLDIAGGAVAGVVTERGRIACARVVLAGGVWSRLFCRPLGVRLPQLKVLSSAMRTGRLDGGPDASASGFGFGLRKRLDGGYTVAGWSNTIADIVPDTLRFRREFWPAQRLRGREITLRLGGRFVTELAQPSRWDLDRPSPFEATRSLDPPPHRPILRQARHYATDAFPVFHGVHIAETWGGMIDMTPDGLPVISSVDGFPGFFIATGFSGHGFGIAPAAGRLMAELLTCETPVVDPSPFRYSRFLDGSKPSPSPLV
jgi:glycine/D-amino acid oxidase-like deaminating enzyme